MAKKLWQLKVGALLSVTLVALAMGLLWMGLVAPTRGAAMLAPPLTDSTKMVNVDAVPAGGTATYSIVLRNTSAVTTVSTATVVDILDSRLSCDQSHAGTQPPGSGLWTCTTEGITFTVQNMTPGKVVTLTFDVTLDNSVLPGDVITNVATIDDGETIIATNEVLFTVSDAPTVQIRQPINGALFTSSPGTQVVISGYAWDTSNDPGFPATPAIDSFSVPSNGAYFVNWTEGADAWAYHLQESTSPYFNKNVVDYNPTTALSRHYVTGKTPGTYYYRLRAVNAVGNSRWSAVRSIVVGTTLMQPLPTDYAAEMQFTAVPGVQVRINGGAWQAAVVTQNAQDYWDWTYNWALPQEDEAVYTIEARSQDTGGNYGEIDTINVTIRNGTRYVYLPLIMRRWPPVPYGTTLTLTPQSAYGNYTLDWVYADQPGSGVPLPTSYTIHEAFNDPHFTNPTVIQHATGGTNGQRVFTGKLPVGTYYYRIRANNQNGIGEWSNTQSVVVQARGYFDDFSNANSGWLKGVYSESGRGVLDVNYDNGTYRMKILRNDLGLNNKYMGVMPAPYTHNDRTYDVQVEHRFIQAVDKDMDPTYAKAGLIFLGTRTSGGTGYFETFYAVEWNFEGQCAVSAYTNYIWDGGHHPYIPRAFLPRGANDKYVYREWPGGLNPSCPGLQAGYNKNVTVRVEVRDNTFAVYFNNNWVGTYSFWGDLPGNPHVGLIAGSWERTPAQSHFDNFRVTDK